MKQRIYLLDNLKLFAMTMVIVSHAVCQYPEFYGGCTAFYGVIFLLINTLCVIRMPLFAIISGFLFLEKDGKKLVKNYLYPCVFFSIMEILSWSICDGELAPYLTFGWSMWYLWVLFWYILLTPILLERLSLKVLFLVSIISALLCGFTPFEYTFSLSRLVTFYPFFLIGVWLQKYHDRILDERRKRGWWILLLIAILVATATLFYLHPNIRHYIDFAVPYYNIWSMCKRLLMYGICTCASISLIMACRNREYWFTKYGARTLNAYLCHMAFVIFPISFCLTMPFLHTWYGYMINLICVPLICYVFYTDTWNRIMSFILLKQNK